MKALSILLLLSALPVLAAEPFTGTWKMDMATAKFSQKPFKLELKDGTYRCPSCDPPITVKADGMDQAVTGHPGVDTVSARVVDDHTVEITDKKAGKVTSHLKLITSADGKSVTASERQASDGYLYDETAWRRYGGDARHFRFVGDGQGGKRFRERALRDLRTNRGWFENDPRYG